MSSATLIFIKCNNIDYILTERSVHNLLDLPCSTTFDFNPLEKFNLSSDVYIELGSMGHVKLRWTRILSNNNAAKSLQSYLGPHYQINSVGYIRKMILDGKITSMNLIGALWFYNERHELHRWACGKYLTYKADEIVFIIEQTWAEILTWGLISCFSKKLPPSVRAKPKARIEEEVLAGILIEDFVIRD